MAGMTRGERTELLSLVRKREKVMRAQAHERSAALLAEFDVQSAKIYHYDEDETWSRLFNEARATVETAAAEIAKRATEMGIPAEFAPQLHLGWAGRGHNAVQSRRTELRRAAKSKIEAMEQEAITKIERLSLEAQTSIVASGLETDTAKSFLERMPIENLMPPVQIGDIQRLIETRRKEQEQLNRYWN